MPNRRTLLTLLAAAAASACTAPPVWATGSLVDLQIVDRARGDTLATYRSRGAAWVAGRPGDRYAVRLTNRSGGRVLVVLSVDGVNAVSGETAAVGQTGYVLAPYQSTEITGWRKSYTEAAAFYFTSLPDSYAARTDRPDNVGVIGAAVFRERAVEPPIGWSDRQAPLARERADAGADRHADRFADKDAEPERRAQGAAAESSAAPAAPSASVRPERDAFAAKQERKLGTGHGEREFSPTSQTAFERASSRPAEVVQVRYDSYANLLAAGIVPRSTPTYGFANPFPGFAPDPR